MVVGFRSGPLARCCQQASERPVARINVGFDQSAIWRSWEVVCKSVRIRVRLPFKLLSLVEA